MASNSDARGFDASLGCLYASDLEQLAAQLFELDISADEQEVILSAAREALGTALYAKLGRLLVLELNAARVTGRLAGDDTHERWNDFIRQSSLPEFWQGISPNYPTMLARVAQIVRNRCHAVLEFARQYAQWRGRLGTLATAPLGALRAVHFGAGDTHQGGKTVAILEFADGKVVHKPRSLAIDAALQTFLGTAQDALGESLSIRVPRVIDAGDHGWAEFVAHRYADGDGELRSFYRGIGHWLAVMRLLGGADLHAENLIAQGGSPIVVDCETLFTPLLPTSASGFGQAFDTAAKLVAGSVLSVGLLPGRGLGLGWRGVDSSALGMLPDQQPMLPQPAILGAGTDEARIGTEMVEAPMALNHPSPHPALARYWSEVIDGFDRMTASLQRIDASGQLEPALQHFRRCRVRFVPRATEVYAEVSRMLWHPVSLHSMEPSIERAQKLLKKMAENVTNAPKEAHIIDAEIGDMLIGDIPFFTAIVGEGRFTGPGGKRWLDESDLLRATLDAWRGADFALERGAIQASLVSAYINDGWVPEEESLQPAVTRTDDLDRRRRLQAERIIRDLVASAIRGDDGSVSWIAPILESHGWAVQPLGQDMYAGVSGVALVAAAYLREVQAGRANPVEGLDAVLSGCITTLDFAERYREKLRGSQYKMRPSPPGGYIGLGSQIWTWLTLARWGMDGGEGVARARRIADDIRDAAIADEANDLLIGTAGAILPLLELRRATGEERYLEIACELGDLLCERAQLSNGQACWTSPTQPRGLGGFAHGATGIGWSLSKLARVAGPTRAARYREMADAAFAFEQSLFLDAEKNWVDLRMEDGGTAASAWCHGAVGIGLAQLDLDPALADARTRELVRYAAAAARRTGIGWNHTACHGDLGTWELLDAAIRVGAAPEGLDREQLLGLILTSIEDNKPTCGFARDAFAPGLLPGLGGVAYQLLRAHPHHQLPSILTLEGAAPEH
jgi:type 2 lantibiotic biosynthesis protein LanM